MTDIKRVFEQLHNYNRTERGVGKTYAKLYMIVGAALKKESGAVLFIDKFQYAQHVIMTLEEICWKTGCGLRGSSRFNLEILKGEYAMPVLLRLYNDPKVRGIDRRYIRMSMD